MTTERLLDTYLLGLPVYFVLFSMRLFLVEPTVPFTRRFVIALAFITLGWPLLLAVALAVSIQRCLATVGLWPKKGP